MDPPQTWPQIPAPLFCCFLWQGQVRTRLSRWLCECYCCACSSKIKGLRKGILWKLFFVSAFRLISYSLEHKPRGRTRTVAPVWLLLLQQPPSPCRWVRRDVPASFLPHVKKCALPWPSPVFLLFIKGGTDCLLQDLSGDSLPAHIPLKNFYPRAYSSLQN